MARARTPDPAPTTNRQATASTGPTIASTIARAVPDAQAATNHRRAAVLPEPRAASEAELVAAPETAAEAFKCEGYLRYHPPQRSAGDVPLQRVVKDAQSFVLRYVVLRGDHLCVFQNKRGADEGKREPERKIALLNCAVLPLKSGPEDSPEAAALLETAFSVADSVFCESGRAERDAWVSALSTVAQGWTAPRSVALPRASPGRIRLVHSDSALNFVYQPVRRLALAGHCPAPTRIQRRRGSVARGTSSSTSSSSTQS